VSSGAAPLQGEHVGQEVRARRVAARLSIAELARRAEVSAPFISQLEAGRTSMSIATLYRVAAALGCTANSLLGASGTRPHVVRAGSGPRLAASGGEHAQQPRLLSRTGGDVLLEAYHYVMSAADDEQEWFQHAGEDFVYVVSGAVVIEFGDGSETMLAAGDSLHHDGTVPHRWVLRDGDPAEVLAVIGSPASGGPTQS
jgi:transcriptional regulator with XRE-family HTH domain